MNDPKPFDLVDVVIANEYAYAGAIGDEGSLDPEMVGISVADVMSKISADLTGEALRQALTVAIPAVIRAHQAELEDGNCNGCGPERREGCQHVCEANADGICYAWCQPCREALDGEAAEVKAAWELDKEVVGTAVNIGLGQSRRTLAELQSAVDRRPETAGLIAAWEAAIERLQELASPPVVSRRRNDDD